MVGPAHALPSREKMQTPPTTNGRASSALRELGYLARLVAKVFVGFYVPLSALMVLLHFPYDTASSNPGASAHRRATNYYDAAYQAPVAGRRGLDYEDTARAAAAANDVEGVVRRFVAAFGLADKRILEVGSGRGYLQDVVADYTGLDI